MSTVNTLDPAAAAGDLADLFNSLSDAVDNFRINNSSTLSVADKSRLKDEAQGLTDRAHYFTAEAIGATLQSIQSDLANIKTVTGQAAAALKTLNNVSKAIAIATSAVALGAAIAAGNPATIASAAQGLVQTIAGQ
jgi:hypothetical protein